MFDRKLFVTRDQLAAEYSLRRSAQAVADHFGVSKKLILRYMKRWDIARREPTPWMAVRDMAAAGKSAIEIGAFFKVCPTAIRLIAKKHGITIADVFHRGFINHNGYRLVRRPNHPGANSKGYVGEHRLIAEKASGRRLTPDEVPHHLNGIKDDNRTENISVMSDVDHRSFHRKRGDCGRKRNETH